ncbi:hypothetical protein Cgig2_024991 [Carnegiea gigantea]|uniref:Uncharacterized protein n=1 Tax=Carnegiea gigantea TaxID=171969 RepID=A0A9Q1GQV5_9CARY|nr:hypothetical protein Cgig2_024991 [Carnegiea gigantea]
MRVVENDVHMALSLPKGPLEVIELTNKSNASVEFASLLNHWKQQWPECDRWKFAIKFGKVYLEDTLDKTTITDEEEEVKEEEHRNKSVKADVKDEGQTGVSKVKNWWSCYLTHVPYSREQIKVAAESTSNVFIKDMPKNSKNSYESEGFLMVNHAIEKYFLSSRDTVCDFPQLTPHNFSLGVSQVEKQTLPK